MDFTHEEVKVTKNRDVLVIGAGLHGLVTAKVLLHASDKSFTSVTIYEKGTTLGGVWALDRIYDGLTTNSPLLTYEIPDFPYPKDLRVTGAHASAQSVNAYLHAYAHTYDLEERIKFRTLVQDVSWNPRDSTWLVVGTSDGESFRQSFGYVVVCVGLYHTSLNPFSDDMISKYTGDVFHSSEMGQSWVRAKLATCQRITVVGAGKSALDLAAILAKGQWIPNCASTPKVTLVYRKPHWLSPRKIIRGTVAFERILFSRFVNAFLPYVKPPDKFHLWVAGTRFGRWQTKQIFKLVADDFIKSNNQQNLPLTIPKHSLQQALSGALHVEPPGYLDLVRSDSIQIVGGTVSEFIGRSLSVEQSKGSKIDIEADALLLATGYKLALPFFSDQTCQMLGIIKPEDALVDRNDLPYLKLYRVCVPPGAASVELRENTETRHAFQNIAFNGFAYSLMNPTVAHVTAHWIADYFSGQIELPSREAVEKDIDEFHTWQTASFGSHGAKGVHIGPHATLYTDTLLADMGLRSGHLRMSIWKPLTFLREWFRPMYPEIYSRVEADRRARVRPETSSKPGQEGPTSVVQERFRTTLKKWSMYFVLSCLLLISVLLGLALDYRNT